MVRLAVLTLVLLAACDTAPVPDAGLAAIRWGGGGGLSGGYRVTLTADDRFQSSNFGPFGEDEQTTTTEGRPGTFAALSQLLATEGLAIQTAADPESLPCVDYGGQYVIADPPIGGFRGISDDCPGDEAVSRFLRRMADVIDGG
jgi:hypothetical protein